MSNLIRSATSGNDWTENDLHAYHIRVVYQDAATFFQIPGLPVPAVQNPAVLTLPGPAAATDARVYQFLRAMDLATVAPVDADSEESAVDDFAVLLFQELGYVPVGRVIRTRKNIPLVICGEKRHAKTDVCIIDDDGMLLLVVQEDKRRNPVPQLVAEAIATFYSNNLTREQTFGVPPLPSKVVPGITMKGTSPIFFKVPVSQELVTAVIGGVYPATETVVQAHVPTIPRPARRLTEGKKPQDNRLIIMSCYEAFKQFVH
ncbi:hypothetical protein C8R46DRAFT_955893 [Mycena filopes]|nr:hypothetical protein C8R46DRAFT_955893 [Mycena filopes]